MFSLSFEIVCSYSSEGIAKVCFRALYLFLRELYFYSISNNEALSSWGEKGESTSSCTSFCSSESDSVSGVCSSSDAPFVVAINARAACSSSELSSSESESSQVAIKAFFLADFLYFFSLGHSFL